MLEMYIEGIELYNEELNEFVYTKGQSLKLEHSLLSISKWEAKWHTPFMTQETNKTSNEQMLDYIRCMTITPNPDPNVYLAIATNRNYIAQIKNYIDDPHTATTIKNNKKGHSREIITSELIYYWMIELGIPFECEKWNLNRLLMLIEVCSIKNTPSKKMSRADAMSQQKSLNALRRGRLNSLG